MRFFKKHYYRLFPTERPVKKKGEPSDIFIVNKDGSLSLNHNSDAVRKALANNVAQLQKIKKNSAGAQN